MPNYLPERHAFRDGAITPFGREVQAKVLELAGSGKTQIAIAKAAGIEPTVLRKLRHADPAFSEELERRLFEASTLVVDEIREVPYQETDAAFARVRIDALRIFLEMRWPQRYGKRLDVTVRTLDMGQALAEARRRRAQVIDGQAIDITPAPDSQSVDAGSAAVIADMLE